MFPEIGRVKIFLSLTRPLIECVSEYILLNKKHKTNKQKKRKTRQKAKETKEETRISVENLTGYGDMVCKFAQCTFNLLD